MGALSNYQIKPCEICGKIFPVSPALSRKRKYCSRSCQGVANSIRFHKNRLIRLELIKNGADLPTPRRSSKRKYLPDDAEPDPDEPTPKQQEEISRSIQALHESRRARQDWFDRAFHKKPGK